MSPAVIAPLKTSRLLSAGALTLSAALFLPIPAIGQDTPAEPPSGLQAPPTQQQVEGEARAPAYIAAVDGVARLDRDGQSEAAERGVPLAPGDRLRTEGGRVELAFPNGSQVYLDRYTEVELADPLALRLARGRLYVRIDSTIDAAERLVIDGPGAGVDFQDDGEYRVAVGGTDAVEVELVVLRGQAALSSEGGNVLVPQGHRAIARDGAAPTTPEWHNAGQTTLEKWAADREALWQSGQYASRQYLPSELSGYASTFDRYGTWQNDETYGAVWYPTSTADDWRPYYDGRWDYSSNYGWTWIAGGDVWAYPTHHYGRWNLGSRGWHWIPSRRWGAAWVYWAVASDYVGWCPLGWNGRPVLSVFNYQRNYPSRSRDPYRAWTVIPRTSFGRSDVARVFADRGRLERDRPAFILQHRGPGIAPPRSPYPSPFNARLNGGRTGGTDRTPASGGVSTTSPRSYGRYGSDRDSRGGSAVPRGTASEENTTTVESPYDRARPHMARPDQPSGDEGNVYRRAPADQSPTRSPNGLWRDRRDRDSDTDRDSDGRAGPGYAGPGYRVRDTPGRSGDPDRDRSPGMSDPKPGSRNASPRAEPPSRRDDDDGGRGNRGGSRDSPPERGASPRSGGGDRGGSDRSGSGADRGGSHSGDSGGSRSSGGGAVRRHP
ncbi:MAG: DUF6600 domain-containing protein [Vicinamibacteraceae bacterium]